MGYGLMTAGRRFAVPALVAALMAACSPQPTDTSTVGQAGYDSSPAPRSAMAAFLAGRFAQLQGNNRLAADYYAAALKFDPENGELLQRAFALMVAEGRMDDAAQMADRLLSFDSDSPLPLLVAALRDAKAGKFSQAEAKLTAMPNRNVFGILEPVLIAWAKLGQGNTDAALASLEPLSQMKGLSALHAFHSALINDLADRKEAAAQAYDRSASEQLAIRVVEAAGSFHARNGQPDKAEALYKRYAADHPDSLIFDVRGSNQASRQRPVNSVQMGMAEALFDMASLMRQGNASDMAMIFSRLAIGLQSDFPLAQMTVAELLGGQNRLADANAMYKSISPSSPVADFGRLRIAMGLDDLGQTDAALAELDKLSRHPRLGVDALMTKGDLLRNRKRFADAVQAYDQALTVLGSGLDASRWMLLFGRAICLERTNRWAEAEADFQKALQLRPDQPDVLNYLGYSWVDQGVNLPQGRAMIEKAVALRPRDGAIVDSLGWALFRMGDFQGAVKQLERAVELRAQDPTINDHLGDAYWHVGRNTEALYQWRRALTLDPEPDVLEQIKQKINTHDPDQKPKAAP